MDCAVIKIQLTDTVQYGQAFTVSHFADYPAPWFRLSETKSWSEFRLCKT